MGGRDSGEGEEGEGGVEGAGQNIFSFCPVGQTIGRKPENGFQRDEIVILSRVCFERALIFVFCPCPLFSGEDRRTN